ncbi:Hypothetical protein GL50581_733 [Giardia duodenalis ATCC 50581]|uniref:Condensin II complex subunit H2 N-terminal domain-containing protein n=1 Tax=Giardia intestinalis (strain ATCC 50581 / GS clone H7) TaxID=598745 RepID=C6LPR5_GIAIB|nr:Hypothetical protein GL50581_733 [Giardia intestinalis ATCC 50581]
MNLEELLKPFKDASAAWEIDIVQILDEYIEDSGFHNDLIDFRSIATLLKGSTNVFARKVDYIHEFATRIFLNCGSNIQTRSKGTRRAQAARDGLSAQIIDFSELPDLQLYANSLCGANPTQIAEDFLSRKIPVPDAGIDIASVDYKIIPKQPATVLLAGDTDNALPTATPFYRAHKDMLTGALLLETWNTSALVRALGPSIEDCLADQIDMRLTGTISKPGQLKHSSVASLDKLVDPVPVCMVTPVALSSVGIAGLGTPRNSRVNLLHGVIGVDATEHQHNHQRTAGERAVTMPNVSAMDHDGLDELAPCQVPVNIEVPEKNHSTSKPKLTIAHLQELANQRRIFDLSINATYQDLIDKLKPTIASDTDHKPHRKSQRTYLDPRTLQVAKDTRLQEIERHPDGFRRCVIKESLAKVCNDIIRLRCKAVASTKYPSGQRQKAIASAKQLSSDAIRNRNNDFNNLDEPSEIHLRDINDGITDPPVFIEQVHSNLEISPIGGGNTLEHTSFESIIQKKILELQREAAVYNTSKSILKWNTYVENILSEEESRPQFNIELLLEKYRSEIIASKTQLSTLCRSTHNRYDVVRSFAAILHIASEEDCLLTSAEDGDIIIN